MEPQDSVVTVNYKGHIAIITLNRPAKLNALNSDHYYQLGERLREVDKRDDIVITVLTGKGRYFSALVYFSLCAIHPSSENYNSG